MTISRNSTTKEEAKFTLIRELTFQLYASKMKCDIYVPEIISTHFYLNFIRRGKPNENGVFSQTPGSIIEEEQSKDSPNADDLDIVCEILMPKIVKLPQEELQSLEDQPKIQLFNKTKNALNCLRQHAIYHNDTHSNNVLFVRANRTIKPCLIDFGKAYCNQIMPTSTGVLVNNDDEVKQFNIWIRGVDSLKEIDIMDKNRNDGIYGGLIKRKTNKHKTKNKKGTKRSNTKKRSSTKKLIRNRTGRKTRRG
jgi:hypothetical protein